MRSALLLSTLVLASVACNSEDPGGGVSPGGNACPEMTGAGTEHAANISAAETWTAAASPHVIPNGMNIEAQVTLEPCAVVKVAADAVITLRPNGSIVANGTSDKPVTIEQRDPGQPWGQIRTIGGTLALTHTKLIGGGAPSNSPLDTAATLAIFGDQYQPPADILFVDNVTIQDSASQGVYMRENGQFAAGSTALTITGSEHAPLHIAPNLAGSIPDGVYTGNARDQITLENGTIDSDVTFHARGVPYHVGDSLMFGEIRIAGSAGVATLTIEPGVEMRFKKGGALYVQYAQNTEPATGALVAAGTANAPIVFTSAEDSPAPGDWLGIYFNGALDPKDKLDFVRVEYAGGLSSSQGSSCAYEDPPKINDAAIRIFVEPTSSDVITNTTIVKSARHGIDRGWLGTASVSFVGNGNDLTDVVNCQESYPRPDGVACPTPPACP